MRKPARYIGSLPVWIMPTRLNRLSSTMAFALLVSGAPAALSQSPPERPPPSEDAVEQSETVQLGRVVVLGMRSSLATAQQIKRGKYEIVDSVVADDIAKLPDFSVTDALQRITGVQIARDRGEGSIVTIRGLTQIETLLNGREVFT